MNISVEAISEKTLKLFNLSKEDLLKHDRSISLRKSEEFKAQFINALKTLDHKAFLSCFKETLLSKEEVAQVLDDPSVKLEINQCFVRCFKMPSPNFALGMAVFSICKPDREAVLSVVKGSFEQLLRDESKGASWSNTVYGGNGCQIETKPHHYVEYTPAYLIAALDLSREELATTTLQEAYTKFLRHCLERINAGFLIDEAKLGDRHSCAARGDAEYATKLLQAHLALAPINETTKETLKADAANAMVSALTSGGVAYGTVEAVKEAESFVAQFGGKLSDAPFSSLQKMQIGFIAAHLESLSYHSYYQGSPSTLESDIDQVIVCASTLGADPQTLHEGGRIAYLRALSRGDLKVAAAIRMTEDLFNPLELSPMDRHTAAIEGMKKFLHGEDSSEPWQPPQPIEQQLSFARKMEAEGLIGRDVEFDRVGAHYIAAMLKRLGGKRIQYLNTQLSYVNEALDYFKPSSEVRACETIAKAASWAVRKLSEGSYWCSASKQMALTVIESGLVPESGVLSAVAALLNVRAGYGYDPYDLAMWEKHFGSQTAFFAYAKRMLDATNANPNSSPEIMDAALNMCRANWAKRDSKFDSKLLTTVLGLDREFINVIALNHMTELLLTMSNKPGNLESAVNIAKNRGKDLSKDQLIKMLNGVFRIEDGAEPRLPLPRARIIGAFQSFIL